jgi:23S rRNA (adenine2503-C2)-methyltransferase
MQEPVKALDLEYGEWVSLVTERFGQPRFRADQICGWIYDKKVFQIHSMTNLSKELRERLVYELLIMPPVLVREQTSQDGTRKFLWQMEDGERIEAVLMDHGNYSTACLSSQAGCPLNCSFCATGQSGFRRNLTVGEIVGQFLAIEWRSKEPVSNIVFMGMGEPLLNEDAVLKSIRILHHPKMRNLGARHITISTSGIVPGIRNLADSGLPIRLSVSIHAPNDQLRTKLMPVNKRYPLPQLMDALRYYQEKTGERITVEYVTIDGVNDDPSLAYELAALFSGMSAYVNLIPCNSTDSAFARSPLESLKAFGAALAECGLEYEVRREKGSDIDAACGQLRNRTQS